MSESLEYREQCGHWEAAYADHHRQIISGTGPQRYLVVQSGSGLADTLGFITGMLYLAVLTGRAFQIDEKVLPYSLVYDQPNIDWRETASKNESLSTAGLFLSTTGELPTQERAFQILRNGSLSDLEPDAAVLHAYGNLGVSRILFDNPHYRKQLLAMGLHPQAAYRCAMTYLFAPTKAVQRHFQKEFETLSQDHFKIGIQMRLGDSFLAGNPDVPQLEATQKHAEAELRSVQHFFDCAEQLEQTYKLDNQEAVWFLVSDSLAIRELATEAYPEKILTQLIQPGHVAATEGGSQSIAMIQAAGEHWLIGMTDYQIISQIGGFGKTGAMRKHSWHTIYRLPTHRIPEPGEFTCDGLRTSAADLDDILREPPFM